MAKRFGLSAPEEQQFTNEDFMKKANRKPANDMRPEYDFASMKGGVRGKYIKQYRAGTNLVLLDPELAQVFPTAAAVNEALRAVVQMTKFVRLPNKRMVSSRKKSGAQMIIRKKYARSARMAD